jgi:hypothetical protein
MFDNQSLHLPNIMLDKGKMGKILKTKTKMIRFVFLMLMIISLLTGACTSRKSNLDRKNLIPEKDLISLLTDIHIADGLLILPTINAWCSNLDSIETYIQVIEKHGYTKEIMDKTMNYYFVNEPKKLNKIYDHVLGILSEWESRIDKQAAVELARITNLWRGKDFYSFPSVSGNDSTMFSTTLYIPGVYKLSFSATFFPDDQIFNPETIAYTSSSDSLETSKKRYITSIQYLKDGRPHNYNLFFQVEDNVSHFKGWLIYFEDRPDEILKHLQIENISLTFSSSVVQ